MTDGEQAGDVNISRYTEEAEDERNLSSTDSEAEFGMSNSDTKSMYHSVLLVPSTKGYMTQCLSIMVPHLNNLTLSYFPVSTISVCNPQRLLGLCLCILAKLAILIQMKPGTAKTLEQQPSVN